MEQEKNSKLVQAQDVKRALRSEKVIQNVIKIANDKGDSQVKICSVRDYLLHTITGYWWDEITIK